MPAEVADDGFREGKVSKRCLQGVLRTQSRQRDRREDRPKPPSPDKVDVILVESGWRMVIFRFRRITSLDRAAGNEAIWDSAALWID